MNGVGVGAAWPLPLRSSAPRARTNELLLKAAIVFALLTLTVLDRFGLSVLPGGSLPAAVLGMYVLAATLVLSGAAELDRRRALAFVAVVTVAGLSFLVNNWFEPRPHQSVTSWMLVVLCYAPFVISLAPGAVNPELWRWTMRMFVGFSLLVAFAGIAQFLLQFVFRPDWLFDYAPHIPDALRAHGGWHTVHPVAAWVQADGYWIKSNGFFLREPSIFSLAMALGIVCGLAIGVRRWIIAVLAAALVLSYSGSGLLCLAIAMAFPLGRTTLLRMLGLAAGAALFVLFLGDALNLSYTMSRVAEFGAEGSSAYCRFVSPWLSVAQHFDAEVWSGLLGHGPGSMTRAGATCVELHEPTCGKLLFEYGLIGAIAFGTLVVQALNQAAAPLRVRIALGVTWFLIGGHLVNSELLPMIFLLCAMWPKGVAGMQKT